MRLKIALYLVIVLFLYNGCHYSRQFAKPGVYSTQLGTMAVMPFDNLTVHSSAGAVATDLFTTELLARESFSIIAPFEIRETLEVEPIADTRDILSHHTISELGSKLEADTLLMGSVTEYEYKKGVRDTPVVGLDVKVVVAETGEILWASSLTREEIGFIFYQGSLNETAQKVCRQLVAELQRSLK